MVEDAELLIQYHAERSETAFAELVRRHVDLVYSAAMRRVNGDPHRATEVTQEVFLAVARQAKSLSRHPVLVAWLHLSTRNTAANLFRAERRRANRHQQGHAMNELNAPDQISADWDAVRPVLDGALDELNDRERQAIMLRFFEGQSYADIGTRLYMREETARKQVGRALDKLHSLLARRGVTSTQGALAAVIAANAVTAAPAGVAAAIMGSTLAATAGAGGTLALAHLAGSFAFKIGLAAAVIAGVTGVFIHERAKSQAGPEVRSAQAPTGGKVEADLNLALGYDEGKLIKRSPQLAAIWYGKAADQGSGAAELRLGYFYEIGDGVPQSYQEARVHYGRAIAQGVPAAGVRLGILDLEGWGGPRDPVAAVAHIKLAAEANDRSAQKILSGMYFAGVGVKKDLQQALAWEAQAAKDDDIEAEAGVGGILWHMHREDAQLAREWYQLSAETDYTRAMIAMASTFLQRGASPDQIEIGRKYLELAAEGKNGDAAFDLAGIYLFIPKYANLPGAREKARNLLKQSAEDGVSFGGEVLELSSTGRSLADAFRYVLSVPSEQRYVERFFGPGSSRMPTDCPKLIKMVKPVYPMAFQLTRTEGDVMIDFYVDTTGRVRNAHVIRTSHPGFSQAALAAIQSWVFLPGRNDGHAVGRYMRAPVEFRLSDVPEGRGADLLPPKS